MSALQETNELLRDLIKVIAIQHQDLIWALVPNDHGAWYRRFMLFRRLQKRHHIFSAEEWKILNGRDLVEAFACMPGLVEAWSTYRKYYTEEDQKFVDELIAKTQSKTRPKKRAKK